MAPLVAERDALAARLAAGWDRCAAAATDGTPAAELARWGRRWIELLRAYERCCDRLAAGEGRG